MDLYYKTKEYIQKNGQDIDGMGEYVIDENINGSQYDFTVAFDDTGNTIEIIEGFILDYNEGYYERGKELFTNEAQNYFDKILENVENNT
jgi:hypothetical protein